MTEQQLQTVMDYEASINRVSPRMRDHLKEMKRIAKMHDSLETEIKFHELLGKIHETLKEAGIKANIGDLVIEEMSVGRGKNALGEE